MISMEEWNARIDAFIREENEKTGRKVPVYRIYCQDDTDRSGGGIYNETVTVDTIGRFARALGDSNPLFSDPRYQPGRTGHSGYSGLFGQSGQSGLPDNSDCSGLSGQSGLPDNSDCSGLSGQSGQSGLSGQSGQSGLSGQSGCSGYAAAGLFEAPPLIECCICSTFIGGKMPRLRGISVFDAGTKWERFLPIRAGDSFSAQTESLGVRDITKPGSAGRLLLREHRIDLINQRGELVSSLTARSAIKCAAPAVHESRKADNTTAENMSGREIVRENPGKVGEGRPHYTAEELEKVYTNLDAQLAGTFRRGAAPRFWEDVEIGEELPEQIIGPYDESDAQALMAAIGAANAFATKWAAIRFRKGQGVTDPETGAHRHPIDRHSSDVMARAQGLPRAIVSGIHSQALLAKSVSDWMGDEGFLRILDCQCRKPLYFGDLSFQRGRVTGKFEKDGKHYVNLEMAAVRQDDIPHTTAQAVVELPSRQAPQN